MKIPFRNFGENTNEWVVKKVGPDLVEAFEAGTVKADQIIGGLVRDKFDQDAAYRDNQKDLVEIINNVTARKKDPFYLLPVDLIKAVIEKIIDPDLRGRVNTEKLEANNQPINPALEPLIAFGKLLYPENLELSRTVYEEITNSVEDLPNSLIAETTGEYLLENPAQTLQRTMGLMEILRNPTQENIAELSNQKTTTSLKTNSGKAIDEKVEDSAYGKIVAKSIQEGVKRELEVLIPIIEETISARPTLQKTPLERAVFDRASNIIPVVIGNLGQEIQRLSQRIEEVEASPVPRPMDTKYLSLDKTIVTKLKNKRQEYQTLLSNLNS